MGTRNYLMATAGTVALAASIFGAGLPAAAHRAESVAGTGQSYSFTTISSTTDPTFTQLLGSTRPGRHRRLLRQRGRCQASQ